MYQQKIKPSADPSIVAFNQTVATTSPTVTAQKSAFKAAERPLDPKIKKAVIQYVKTVRSLGKTTINTNEIAGALGISKSDVLRTLPFLEAIGVKR